MRLTRTPEEQVAVDTFKAAQEALDAHGDANAPIREATPEYAEYLRLNQAVADAEPALLAVPLHLRRVIL